MKKFTAILLVFVMAMSMVAHADGELYDYEWMTGEVECNDLIVLIENDTCYASISSYGEYKIYRAQQIDVFPGISIVWWIAYRSSTCEILLAKGWAVTEENYEDEYVDYKESTYKALCAMYWMTELRE